jgi:hypothetical protein
MQETGIEMGYRYGRSPIVLSSGEMGEEPAWYPTHYVPSTWPGARAPHVFLSDGRPIFDLYGEEYTLVDFTPDGRGVELIRLEEKHAIVHIHLPNEPHARKIWERDLVLVRPDGHVSWRASDVPTPEIAAKILKTALGWEG